MRHLILAACLTCTLTPAAHAEVTFALESTFDTYRSIGFGLSIVRVELFGGGGLATNRWAHEGDLETIDGRGLDEWVMSILGDARRAAKTPPDVDAVAAACDGETELRLTTVYTTGALNIRQNIVFQTREHGRPADLTIEHGWVCDLETGKCAYIFEFVLDLYLDELQQPAGGYRGGEVLATAEVSPCEKADGPKLGNRLVAPR